MTAQREFFSRGQALKIARSTWRDSILEETVVKVLMDGLTACRIPVFRVRERIPRCHRCHQFVGRASQQGIPDLIGWIPHYQFRKSGVEVYAPARPLFVEVKRPKGGLESAVQKEFIDRARKGGAVAFFCRSWDECADQLRSAGVQLPEGL